MAENIVFRFKQKQNPPPKPKNVKQMLFSTGLSFKKKLQFQYCLRFNPTETWGKMEGKQVPMRVRNPEVMIKKKKRRKKKQRIFPFY